MTVKEELVQMLKERKGSDLMRAMMGYHARLHEVMQAHAETVRTSLFVLRTLENDSPLVPRAAEPLAESYVEVAEAVLTISQGMDALATHWKDELSLLSAAIEENNATKR